MRMSLVALAIAGAISVPAAANTAPADNNSATAPAPTHKTVTKIVCKRVDVEETTGSRLGSAPKVCKKVEVLVESAAGKQIPDSKAR